MTELKVIVFEGVQNLPLFAALANGLFAGQGLDIDLTFTPDSGTLRNGLAEGRFDIAHTAVDNAIAMVELAHKDVAIVLGGDNGFNGLFFQPEIASFEDLRGKTVLVDAPNTAFALVLYKILDNHGLKRGDYAIQPVGATPFRLARMKEDKNAAAAILNLPYRILGSRAGLKFICDAVSEIGPYLSTTVSCCVRGPRPMPTRWFAISGPMSAACVGPSTRRTSRRRSGCWRIGCACRPISRSKPTGSPPRRRPA
jgi:hypothetical protein